MQFLSYYNFMHFHSTSVHDDLLLTQFPDCCVSFQIVIFCASLHLINCVGICYMSMLNNTQFNSIQYILKSTGERTNLCRKPLFRVQNYAAQLIVRSDRLQYITTVLNNLHWLPVKSRTTNTIPLLTSCSAWSSTYLYLRHASPPPTSSSITISQ